MTLEILAGAFDIVAPDATVLTPSNGAYAFYDDSLGLCTYSSVLGGYSIVQLDGTAHLRSDTDRQNKYVVDLQRPGDYCVHQSGDESDLYEFDKSAGVFGEAVLSSSTTNWVVDIQVRCADRYLSVSGSAVRFKPLDNSGSWTTEATLTSAGSGAPSISLSRATGVLCLVYLDGKVLYYDAINKVQVGGTANIGANNGAWYSPKFNVLVALVSNKVKIFATVPRPATLSNPVEVTSIVQGRVSQVRVQLLGSNSEACPDEIIEWSITAGLGTLANAQSTTDESGFAYMNYRAPVDSTGTATVQAEVVF